jgi:Flp pilus assembly protein TadG
MYCFDRTKFTCRFLDDQRGSVGIIFGVVSVALVLAAGTAIDYGRASAARSMLQNAADSASLVAARSIAKGETNAAKITAEARAVFRANFSTDLVGPIADDKIVVTSDMAAKKVTVNASTRIDTTLMKLADIAALDLTVSSTSLDETVNYEIALMVDVTGSMADKTTGNVTKIAKLKTSATKFLDMIMPADGSLDGRTRVAIAPFSEGVNAGAYAKAVTGGLSAKCAVEREGGYAYSDQPPTVAPLGVSAKAGCPAAAILPLTDKRSSLDATIKSLSATGTTAGHIGTAWARYLLSDKWGYLWPSSAPVAAGTPGIKKIAILMTDGIYNTSYSGGVETVTGGTNPKAITAAKAMCAAMKTEGTVVYTIGFQLDNAVAKDVLQDCASEVSNPDGTTTKLFFDASDGDKLEAAYAEIARQLLQTLRLSA